MGAYGDGLDFGFLLDLAYGLEPTSSTVYRVLVNSGIMPEASEKEVENHQEFLLGIINLKDNRLATENNSMTHPYVSGKLAVAKSEDSRSTAISVAKNLSNKYQEVLSNKELDKYPATKKFFEFQKKMADSAVDGIDRYGYLRKLSAENYALGGNPDWKNVIDGKNVTAEEMEDMLQGMQYDKMWDELDKRIDLEITMDKKSPDQYTEEEKRIFANQIKESNDALIAIYEHRITGDREEKFGKYFKNWGGENGTVSGNRGVNSAIAAMKEENAALDRGWDPTRISDYKGIKRICDNCRRDAFTDQYADPVFDGMKERMAQLAALNPENKTFTSKKEFDAYLKDLHSAMENLSREVNKPEVQNAINKRNQELNDTIKDKDSATGDEKKALHEQKRMFANNGMLLTAEKENRNRLEFFSKKMERDVPHISVNAALHKFNTKRTDKWLSSESKYHKDLRECAEQLQRDMDAYRAGVYQDGSDKGKPMTAEDREKLQKRIQKEADEVDFYADVYLKQREGKRFTEAGNDRKVGAESLKIVAKEIQETIKKERERDMLESGFSIRYEGAEKMLKYPDPDTKRESLVKIIAAKSLSKMVEKGQLDAKTALSSVPDMEKKIQESEGLKSLMNQDVSNLNSDKIYGKWLVEESKATKHKTTQNKGHEQNKEVAVKNDNLQKTF